MPVRDDWASAMRLIECLDVALASDRPFVDVLLIDDGSSRQCPTEEIKSHFVTIRTIRVVRLRRNLGHQRAIAIGLAYIQAAPPTDAVLVMDADGEDTADGAAKLVSEFLARAKPIVIFAERSRRTESVVFRLFYRLYRVLHKALTGIGVRVGNFSILPADYLDTLVAMSELWNHYAAAVFRSKLPYTMVPIPRGTRIAGESRMNFTDLVSHGLSAISVFGDIVGVRILIGALMGSFLASVGIVLVIAVRLFTSWAIPGWATYATGVLGVIMIQFITIAASFTFFVLSSRTNLGFVPLRDYSLFLKSVVDIYCHERV